MQFPATKQNSLVHHTMSKVHILLNRDAPSLNLALVLQPVLTSFFVIKNNILQAFEQLQFISYFDYLIFDFEL